MRKKIGIVGGQETCQAVADMLQAPFDALCANIVDFRQIPQAFESLDAAGVGKIIVDDGALGDSNDAVEALRSAAETLPGRVIFATSRSMEDPLLFQLATQAGADIFIPGIQVDAASVLTRYAERGSDPTERSAWVVADPSDPRIMARRKTMGFMRRHRLGEIPPLSIVEKTCGSADRLICDGNAEGDDSAPQGPSAGDNVVVPEDDDSEAGIELLLAEATEEDAGWLGDLADEMDPDGSLRAGFGCAEDMAEDDSGPDWMAEHDEEERETVSPRPSAYAAHPEGEGRGEPDMSAVETGDAGDAASSQAAPERERSSSLPSAGGEDGDEEEDLVANSTHAEDIDMKEKAPAGSEADLAADDEDMESIVEAVVSKKIKELTGHENAPDDPVSWAEPLPADNEKDEEIIPLADLLGRRAPDSEKPGRGKITAIVGVRHGVGCTYLSCILASELAACGERTALVLCNTEDYRNIARTINATQGSSEYCFRFNEVDVFNWRNRKAIRTSTYDQIVYDLGVTDLSQPDGDTPASLFMRANLQIILLSAAPWDLHCVNDLLLSFSPDVLRHWTWAFWGAGKRGRESLLHGLRNADALGPGFSRLFTIQARPDFFSADFKPQLDLYRNLVAPVLPKDSRAKRKAATRKAADAASDKGSPERIAEPAREASSERDVVAVGNLGEAEAQG